VELLIGAVILVGIAGTVVPFLPGPLLVAAAVLVYALVEQTQAAWLTCAICLAILVVGFVLKWVIPARHVSGEVDRLPLFVGGILAVVGFFVIPIVGLVIGFVAGVFGTELVRSRSPAQAWPATRRAITAAGISMLIDLAAVVVTGCVWLVAVVLY
jgi:uncharacterized protein